MASTLDMEAIVCGSFFDSCRVELRILFLLPSFFLIAARGGWVETSGSLFRELGCPFQAFRALRGGMKELNCKGAVGRFGWPFFFFSVHLSRHSENCKVDLTWLCHTVMSPRMESTQRVSGFW